MTISADLNAIAAGIAASSDATEFTLEATTDPDTARRALRAIGRRLQEVPHPDETGDPFVSFIGRVTAGDDRAWFSAGMSDLEAYPGLAERLAAAVVAAADEVPEADGLLTAGPPQQVPYLRPLRPEWFPLPPGATQWDGGADLTDDVELLQGTVDSASFKCGVPLDRPPLVAFYTEHLLPMGFELTETTREGDYNGLLVEVVKAKFVRGQQVISVETQTLALTPETPADIREEFSGSTYAHRAEAWIRLRSVAEALEMVWDESLWRWVPPT